MAMRDFDMVRFFSVDSRTFSRLIEAVRGRLIPVSRCFPTLTHFPKEVFQ